MARRISKTERHIRWNWEKSPEDEALVRYHIVVVDDRDRSGILNKIAQQLQEYGSVNFVREDVEASVKNSGLRYLFTSFDTVVAPRMISWSVVGKPVVRDRDLRERKAGKYSIEDYVSRLYE